MSDRARPHDAGLMIPCIDAEGGLYPVEKLEAHRRGLKHLAISVFVFCGDDLLLQRRAIGKYHSGLLWTNTCCSHPHMGEEIGACAARRVGEELGFTLPLVPACVVDYRADVGNGLIENERVHLFVGRADRNALRIAPDPAEVADTRWIAPEALTREVAQRPEAFSAWMRIYLADPDSWRRVAAA